MKESDHKRFREKKKHTVSRSDKQIKQELTKESLRGSRKRNLTQRLSTMEPFPRDFSITLLEQSGQTCVKMCEDSFIKIFTRKGKVSMYCVHFV